MAGRADGSNQRNSHQRCRGGRRRTARRLHRDRERVAAAHTFDQLGRLRLPRRQKPHRERGLSLHHPQLVSPLRAGRRRVGQHHHGGVGRSGHHDAHPATTGQLPCAQRRIGRGQDSLNPVGALLDRRRGDPLVREPLLLHRIGRGRAPTPSMPTTAQAAAMRRQRDAGETALRR